MSEPSRASWRRDIAFYGVIPALTAWQALECKWDVQTLTAVILAALLGMKAKLSNGHPKDKVKE